MVTSFFNDYANRCASVNDIAYRPVECLLDQTLSTILDVGHINIVSTDSFEHCQMPWLGKLGKLGTSTIKAGDTLRRCFCKHTTESANAVP